MGDMTNYGTSLAEYGTVLDRVSSKAAPSAGDNHHNNIIMISQILFFFQTCSPP